MKCPFCNREFDADEARRACRGCSLMGGCRRVKCPHCGYEQPDEPRLVKWIRSKLQGKK